MYMTHRMCLRCHNTYNVPHDPNFSLFICDSCVHIEEESKRIQNKFRPIKPSIKRPFK